MEPPKTKPVLRYIYGQWGGLSGQWFHCTCVCKRAMSLSQGLRPTMHEWPCRLMSIATCHFVQSEAIIPEQRSIAHGIPDHI